MVSPHSPIKSKANPTFKFLRKLLDKKGRIESGRFLVEGFRAVTALLNSHYPVVYVIKCDGTTLEENICLREINSRFPKATIIHLCRELFREISRTETPQHLMVCAEGSPLSVNLTTLKSVSPILCIENLQDPRNFGAFSRLADALGLPGLIFIGQHPDPWHPLVIQSSVGSVFNIGFCQFENSKQFADEMGKAKLRVLATDANAKKSFHSFFPSDMKPIALLFGNEGKGLSPALREIATDCISIPIFGKAESLNVAMSAAILGYYFKVSQN